jgi:hypothetical protein
MTQEGRESGQVEHAGRRGGRQERDGLVPIHLETQQAAGTAAARRRLAKAKAGDRNRPVRGFRKATGR